MEAILSPTLIINKTSSRYNFFLKDMALTDDVNELGCAIEDVLLKESDTIRKVIIDISKADDVLFKPDRLFGICTYFNTSINAMHKDLQLQLTINSRQHEIFQDTIEGFNFPVNIIDEPDDYFWHDEISVKTKKSINVQFLIYAGIIPLMVICAFMFLGSELFFKDKLLNFGLRFSSGILLYEGFLLLKIYRKTRIPSKVNNI